MLEIPNGVYSALHLAILRFKDFDLQSRLYENLKIELVHKFIIFLYTYNLITKSNLGFKEGDFPEAEFYSKNCLRMVISGIAI